MQKSTTAQRILLLSAVTIATFTPNAWAKNPSPPQSQWVHLNPSGKLIYKQLERGDRIVDFSYAGYMGGGVALPTFPIKKTVTPSGTDDTAAIQSAIDQVSTLPLTHGIRGAVQLTAGRFRVNFTLKSAPAESSSAAAAPAKPTPSSR